jgi:hypothetical protein
MSYTKESYEWLNIRANNSTWFSKSAIRFFGSRIYWNTLTPYKDGWAFISSEGDDYNRVITRGWTIRFIQADWKMAADLTQFREYEDLDSAKKKLGQLIKEEGNNVTSNN